MKDRLRTNVMTEYLIANLEYANAMLAEVIQGACREEQAIFMTVSAPSI